MLSTPKQEQWRRSKTLQRKKERGELCAAARKSWDDHGHVRQKTFNEKHGIRSAPGKLSLNLKGERKCSNTHARNTQSSRKQRQPRGYDMCSVHPLLIVPLKILRLNQPGDDSTILSQRRKSMLKITSFYCSELLRNCSSYLMEGDRHCSLLLCINVRSRLRYNELRRVLGSIENNWNESNSFSKFPENKT